MADVNRSVRIARWLIAEADYLIWQSGIRGYCHRCDRLRWAWTHRGHGCWRYEVARGRR